MFKGQQDDLATQRDVIAAACLSDERVHVESLITELALERDAQRRIQMQATALVTRLRARPQLSGLEAFLSEYDLSSEEGVALMCLAEALLRIPDTRTADRLIHDQLGPGDWSRHLGHSRSWLVNAASWGLLLTGRIVSLDDRQYAEPGRFIGRLVARSGEPVLRRALQQAMQILGRQFVIGQTIDEAVQCSRHGAAARYRYSFDMLGEAALTADDAERYLAAYRQAITRLGTEAVHYADLYHAPGISVKLSALHPRYEFAQAERLRRELLPRIIELCQQACAAGIALTLDAEESERLEPMLDVVAALIAEPSLRDWPGLGLAVQAYQKRAPAVIDYLAELARRHQRRLMIRLVKGAYWDSEVKRAQERGLDDYPVLTRKQATDISYLVCAQRLFAAAEVCYPMLATHNAQTIAAIIELADGREDFEFQRLHGMGEDLHDMVIDHLGRPCRVYAPVGSYQVLLAYLVRRMLENGANTSFVNLLTRSGYSIEQLVADPVESWQALADKRHPLLPRPGELYSDRSNSRGLNLHDRHATQQLRDRLRDWAQVYYDYAAEGDGELRRSLSPADSRDAVGQIRGPDAAQLQQMLQQAEQAFAVWSRRPVDERAGLLEAIADQFEIQREELLALIIREGGRCIPDAVSELREAIDYCRYYAAQARALFGAPRCLPGPVGEENLLSWHGRGVFVAISPWNFPLAIFCGQVVAALASGNAVIAKPSMATPLVARRAVELMHQAGIPGQVLQLLPIDGDMVARHVLGWSGLAGVVFTGSMPTARGIQRVLAQRDGRLLPLIAETGGVNVMIADSSALAEQLVPDVIQSAFNSAGQRCSALRVLFVQQPIADRVLDLIQGMMAQLKIGDPAQLATDIGPVIDAHARQSLQAHCAQMRNLARRVIEAPLPDGLAAGHYAAPACYEIDSLSQLPVEVFGPVLHVIRFNDDELSAIVDAINAAGYGLTAGVHTRIASTADFVRERLRVGNLYINRNMIGAVVGVQPFGGEAMSGTGPKAGGPHYLQRFATERVVSINRAAVGGNAALLRGD
ncbi:MAG: bifunctional proline dehydrogenase/L-glutamate gamma-semialdehyde dehydrogenase PutA [Gammaproteobacteria bacterium]|nr:bifunctional proline dehydrogenase/L-glutamate gamma-semialdehyde dehydrogenase PutA [Gammaproteobacteria bacterium]